jgi:hypothetical protein
MYEVCDTMFLVELVSIFVEGFIARVLFENERVIGEETS